LQREDVQDAAKKLRRRCLNGLTAIDGQNRSIPEIEWRHLKIVLHTDNTPYIVRRGQSSTVPAYPDVIFLRDDVLRELPPALVEPTYIDPDYDERSGEALRPWPMVEAINLDPSGEPATAPIELPAPATDQSRRKKSPEEKKADALEIAKTFVVDGVAPNYKDHATAVMGVLKGKHPQNHIRREDLEILLQATFKRREPGEKIKKRNQ
jgi:hypothetical protein